MPASRHFLYLIKPNRANFIDDMTPQEEGVMAPELHPFRLSLSRRQPAAGSQQAAE